MTPIRLSLAVVVLLAACGKAPDPVCQQLDTSIDENSKRIALLLAQGEVFDKGATQQSARYTMANNHLQVIRLNVELQTRHNCPIRKSVIDPFLYQADALKCLSSTIGDKKNESSGVCDFKNWKGR